MTLEQEIEKAGLRSLGPVMPGIGCDGGFVVRHQLNAQVLEPFKERYNLTPNGPHQTIIWPKRGAS